MAAPTIAYPLPPVEFGRDGGEFYKHYDKIADELDNGMMKGLKSSLDGLLIFVRCFFLFVFGALDADVEHVKLATLNVGGSLRRDKLGLSSLDATKDERGPS